MEKHILFVCRYNRFRSVLAEGLFNKYNKDKSIKAKSAGAIKGSPLSENTRKLAKEFKIKIKRAPQGLSSKLLVWQNTTIIVADDVPPQLFDKNKEYGKEVIVWKIRDANGNGITEMRRITKEIEKNVKDLVKKV